MKIGLIGVGTMGSRMAEALIASDLEVVVRDISSTAEDRARALGATVMNSPAAVASASELVLISLPKPADVELVVTGKDGLLMAERLPAAIIDLSTVDPATTVQMAQRARERGVGYLDAPVLGRPANCGKWTLPVGGDPTTLRHARATLEVLAQRVVHVGESGHGNVIKLLNNLMFGAISTVTAEIMAICARTGVPARVLFETISASGAASVSNLFLELAPKILDDDFAPVFAIDLLHKDVKLALEMAESVGAPAVLSRATELMTELARANGSGPEDTSAVVKVYRALYGTEASKPQPLLV